MSPPKRRPGRSEAEEGPLWNVSMTPASDPKPKPPSMAPSHRPPTGADGLDALHNDIQWTLSPALANAVAAQQTHARIPVRELACVISLVGDLLNHGYRHLDSAFMSEPLEDYK